MLGLDLLDASFFPAALIALVAGVLSFLSPCVLPIVPPYLAYIGGVGVKDLRAGSRAAILPAAFFVLGLSTVFLFLGFAASAFGRFILDYQTLFARLSGAVIILIGLHFLGLIRLPFLNRDRRLDVGDQGGSSFGAYLLGLAFAFGWTPCIGPQLGAILSLAAQQGGDATRGLWLLAIYAAGMGLPFLLCAVFIRRAFALLDRLRRHMGLIEKVSGLLLLLVGTLLLTNAFATIAYWLLETFPALARLG